MNKEKRRQILLPIAMGLVLVPVAILLCQVFFFDFEEVPPYETDIHAGNMADDLPNVPEVISRIEDREREAAGATKEIERLTGDELVSPLYQGIQARVVDAFSGKPLGAYTVYYCLESGEEAEIIENVVQLGDQAKAFRRPDGILRLYGLEEGTYAVAIRAQGHPLFIEHGLKVPQKKPLLDFEIPRGTFIEGKVVDVDGKPVSGVRVFLSVELQNPENDPPPSRRTARTASDGMFLFGGLPPGRYDLALSSLHRPLAEVKDIYLGRGNRHYQELMMPRMNELDFLVTDAFGNPLPNASIKLWEKEGRTVISMKTDMYGKAIRKRVPPGDYELRISKNTYNPLSNKHFKILPGSGIISLTRTLRKSENR